MIDNAARLRPDLPIAVAMLATGLLVLARSWLIFSDLGFAFAPCLGFPLGICMAVLGARSALREFAAMGRVGERARR